MDYKPLAIRGEEFDTLFSHYHFSEELASAREVLNTKTKSLKEDQLSYRLINHWEKMGLLSTERLSGKGWRKYSLIDLVWVCIIARLRNFGYPLEKVKEVKSNLEKCGNQQEENVFPILEYYIASAIFQKSHVYILVYENGQCEPLAKNEYKANLDFFELSNYILIDLNKILQNMFPSLNLHKEENASVELTPRELDLLSIIRFENYDSITIKLSNGKIVNLDASESIEAEKSIGNILREKSYQDIEIKKRAGSIVHIKRTTKKKYDLK
ncbi:MerR family transcriptional regulator [candidate division KSB1 bacterium]